MELCHARYNFERVGGIHKCLFHVLLNYACHTADENLHFLDDLRLGYFLVAVYIMMGVLIDRAGL
jgi:hypothetical protein